MRHLCLLLCLLSAITASAQSIITAPQTINLSYLADDQRLGIQINIGNGAWTEPYLFDTGSYEFMSGWADGAPWWGAATVNTSVSGTATYGGGSGENQLIYYSGSASIRLTDGTTSVVATGPVSQVYTSNTNANPANPVADWQPNVAFNNALVSAVTTGDPPFASMAGPTFGIYGAGLFYPGTGLYGMLQSFTYADGISSGYIVSTASPSLTIGLTAESIATFSTTYAMNTTGGGAIAEGIISPDYSITSNGVTVMLSDLPTLLDTGTPPGAGIIIEQGTLVDFSDYIDEGDNYLRYGTTLTMLIAGAPYTLTSTLENPIWAFEGNPANEGFIVYGLNFFQNYDVMYDLDTFTVGIAAIPEPGTYALLSLGGLLVFAKRWRA